nr:hypothetical protein [uncultured Fusobacterium sp.]
MKKERINKELLEVLRRDSVLIPRQALGKYPYHLIGPIFSILPLFYREDRKDIVILTEEEMSENLFFIGDVLFNIIEEINNTELYSIKVLENKLCEVAINKKNMEKFLKDIYKLECIIIENQISTYEEDENLSFAAIKLLNLLLNNENLKNISTHFDFSWVLTSISFIEKEDIEKIKNSLEELKKSGYCYLFDILDRKNISRGIEKQVIIISNCLLNLEEAKNYLSLSEKEIVAIYPIGEVR